MKILLIVLTRLIIVVILDYKLAIITCPDINKASLIPPPSSLTFLPDPFCWPVSFACTLDEER
jgi:hypothetical protein